MLSLWVPGRSGAHAPACLCFIRGGLLYAVRTSDARAAGALAESVIWSVHHYTCEYWGSLTKHIVRDCLVPWPLRHYEARFSYAS